MARFFFDWRDNGNFEEDDEGMELPDLDAAKAEASRALIERAREEVSGRDRHSLSMEIRDESRRSLLSVDLVLEVRTPDSSNRPATR